MGNIFDRYLTRTAVSAVLVVLMLLVLSVPAQAGVGPGNLDPTFGGDGIAMAAFPGEIALAYDVAVDSDNNVYAAGYNRDTASSINEAMALAKFLEDGTLDTSFGNSGLFMYDPSPNFDVARSVAVQDDGRVILAGYEHNGTDYDISVIRVTTAGELDPSFGTGGVVVFDFDPDGLHDWADQAQAVTIQEDGKIVIAGFARITDPSNDTNKFIVARLNSDGSFDTSFGSSGTVSTQILDGNGSARAVTIDEAGNIVVGGFVQLAGNHYQAVVVRYDTNGVLDGGFGSGGITTMEMTADNSIIRGLDIDAQGRIISGGYTGLNPQYDWGMLSQNSDGSLNTGFDTDGKKTHAHDIDNDMAYDLVIDTDNRYVLVGMYDDGSTQRMAFSAFTEDGSLDASFGDGGNTIVAPGDSGSNAFGGTVDNDGRVLGAGYAFEGGAAVVSVVRLGDPADPVYETPPKPYSCTGFVVRYKGTHAMIHTQWRHTNHGELQFTVAYKTGSGQMVPVADKPGLAAQVIVPREYANSLFVRAVNGDAASDWCSITVRERSRVRHDGTGGRDTIAGSSARDTMLGKGGNDRMRGRSGNDRMHGGSGRDLLLGDSGRDLIIGGSGRDLMAGGPGNDKLNGRDGRGGDLLHCGAGKRDIAIADPGDRVHHTCERVIRR